jgi:hypothetical protein
MNFSITAVHLVALILAMTCSLFSTPTVRAQQQQQQQQQQPRSSNQRPEINVTEIQNSAKTECLASNEEFSSFHCLPAQPLRMPCEDAKHGDCPKWKEHGECSNNPQYMMVHCRKSCQTCIGLHQGGVLQIAPSQQTRPQVLQRLVETQEYQHLMAERNVESFKSCFNNHELCTHWSLEGECETNAHYMNRECPAACRTCVF